MLFHVRIAAAVALSTSSVYAGDICSHGLQEMMVHCYGSPES
jgi:hypothetical protein